MSDIDLGMTPSKLKARKNSFFAGQGASAPLSSKQQELRVASPIHSYIHSCSANDIILDCINVHTTLIYQYISDFKHLV